MEYTGLRGGKRPNSGRKKGSTNNLTSGLCPIPPDINAEKVDVELEGVDMPSYDECLKSMERDGTELGADKIFKKMYEYVYKFGCKDVVPTDLIENYALHRSRFLKCQKELSRLGYIAAHPTTHSPIATPYAALMNLFDKSQNHAYFLINEIIKANNPNGYVEYTEKDYAMARLLDS